MKLLASLLGCAVADYACCPYDDFGVVNSGCPLSEKTPWAMDSNNADPMGVEHHLCKAWEANVDATFEGNEDFDNWGGCGFQRHFPWNSGVAMPGATTNTDLDHCKLGIFDCSLGTMSTQYNGLQAGALTFSLSGSNSGFSNGGTNAVFGQVTLGAVCKLWIPVRRRFIDSVSVTGVHMNGGGTTDNVDNGAAAVFDNAKVCPDSTCSNPNGNAVGTAYCFSVVNIAEFMENNMPGSQFNVMNSNVAGKDEGGHDPIKLEGPTFEDDFDVNFGDSIVPTLTDGGSNTIVESGANFDVVVHFKSQWCMRHWTRVDMQNTGDWGNAVLDYEVISSNPATPHHHHTDVMDKRFSGQVGICGCCDAAGVRHDDDSFLSGGLPSNPVVSNTGAGACTACTGFTNTYQNCDNLNKYDDNVPAGMKWPNAGAWAAFYSFITCSNNQFMVYDLATAVDATTGAITVTAANRKKRIAVHSMFYNDIRHDYSNNHHNTGQIHIRGNIRQVGSNVVYCGPGVINTAAHDQSIAINGNAGWLGLSSFKRCTWNWNFHEGNTLSTNTAKDPEEWFSRTNPMEHVVWSSGVATDRGIETNNGFQDHVSPIVESVQFTMTFQDDTDAGPTPGALTRVFSLDAAKYFTEPTKITSNSNVAVGGHAFTFTLFCLQSSLDGNGLQIPNPTPANGVDNSQANAAGIGDTNNVNIRDIFPDCYMGDEIHFNYAITGGTNANNDHRISAWYSFVDAVFQSSA